MGALVAGATILLACTCHDIFTSLLRLVLQFRFLVSTLPRRPDVRMSPHGIGPLVPGARDADAAGALDDLVASLFLQIAAQESNHAEVGDAEIYFRVFGAGR